MPADGSRGRNGSLLSTSSLVDRAAIDDFSASVRGDSVKSRNPDAMVNEVLCKFLCHNLCCLIQEQHELGIDPVFWSQEATEKNPNSDAPGAKLALPVNPNSW